MRVSIGAGLTVLTRIPQGAHSSAALRISPMTACLLVVYAERPTEPRMPAVEEVMMMPTATSTHRWDGILEPQPDAAYVHSHDLIEDVNGIVGNGLHYAFDPGVGEQMSPW